uniref:Peptide hormone 2 n=1 Tax=Periplaneta americana TaxID=6978 RepID=PH2_PERAM|nr:RecName: Full=Peptide hormone 2; AltName: Full=Pea-VEAacid 2 [Periplaneta americana]
LDLTPGSHVDSYVEA